MGGLALLLLLTLPLLVVAAWVSARSVLTSRASSHRDALWAVRVHGVVTSAAALLYTVGSGLGDLGLHGMPEAEGQALPGGWIATPEHLPAWPASGLLLSLAPPVLVGVVHVLAQLTVPAPTGEVRSASLTARPVHRLVPRGLAVLAALIAAGVVVMASVVAREPGTPTVIEPEGATEVLMRQAAGHRATAPGGELAPWLLLGLTATVVMAAVVLTVLARRRALPRLSVREDAAVRAVAAHRLLRTVVWMLWMLLAAGWGMLVTSRDSRATLAGLLPDHPAALPLGGFGALGDTVAGVGTAATVALAVALLLWRPPALRELRPARPAAAATEPTGTGPAAPGAAEAGTVRA